MSACLPRPVAPREPRSGLSLREAAGPAGEAARASRVTTSVLVNTCNQEDFIEDCIDSLLVQSVLPDEIIVYDDGSTDGTLERLQRYGERIVVLAGRRIARPNHLGQAHAIHAAFLRSTGRLVFLLDGDDRFKRTKIEHFAHVMASQPEVALIQSPMDKVDRDGRFLGSNEESRKHVTDPLRQIYRDHDVDLFYPTSALAFARRVLEELLPIDFSDGMPLWADTRLSVVAPHFGPIVTLPRAETDWRRHAQSDSIRVRQRRHQLDQTVMRTRAFNRFCRERALPRISLWRNRRFYLQLLRYALPDRAYDAFRRRRRARLNPSIRTE